MKFGIDLDDVMAVCAVPYLRRFAEEYGVELPDEKELGWHLLARMDDRVPPRERNRFRQRLYSGDFFATLDLYEGCSLVLERMVSAGHELYFVTARGERWRVVTETWLREKGVLTHAKEVHLKPSGDFRPSIRSGAYDAHGSARYKVGVAKRLRLDVFLEDDEVISQALAEAGIRVWLFDRPWNREVAHPNVARVNGWDDVGQRLGI